jgi:hypothetical protein
LRKRLLNTPFHPFVDILSVTYSQTRNILGSQLRALREYANLKDRELEKTVRKVIREELKTLANST